MNMIVLRTVICAMYVYVYLGDPRGIMAQ